MKISWQWGWGGVERNGEGSFWEEKGWAGGRMGRRSGSRWQQQCQDPNLVSSPLVSSDFCQQNSWCRYEGTSLLPLDCFTSSRSLNSHHHHSIQGAFHWCNCISCGGLISFGLKETIYRMDCALRSHYCILSGRNRISFNVYIKHKFLFLPNICPSKDIWIWCEFFLHFDTSLQRRFNCSERLYSIFTGGTDMEKFHP